MSYSVDHGMNRRSFLMRTGRGTAALTAAATVAVPAVVKARGAELIVISDDTEALALGRVALALPAGVPEWLSPICAIVPGQLLAMHLSHTRDLDPDQPRALLKVTETL